MSHHTDFIFQRGSIEVVLGGSRPHSERLTGLSDLSLMTVSPLYHESHILCRWLWVALEMNVDDVRIISALLINFQVLRAEQDIQSCRHLERKLCRAFYTESSVKSYNLPSQLMFC